jgi:hypothetical protein
VRVELTALSVLKKCTEIGAGISDDHDGNASTAVRAVPTSCRARSIRANAWKRPADQPGRGPNASRGGQAE